MLRMQFPLSANIPTAAALPPTCPQHMFSSDATFRNTIYRQPERTLPRINQYPNIMPNQCFSAAGGPYQNALIAPLPPSNATSPALQSTRQCPCTHNALNNRPSNNARPAQFKPCHTNTPHHRRVNTKPNPEPPLPLPKLSTPA